MAKKIQIKGLKKTLSRIDRAVNKVVAPEVAEAYRDEIVDNLKESKDTGALMKSFKVINKTNYSLIESNLDYADIQDSGGKIRITTRMRKKMWALYAETGLSVYKAIALTKKSFITIKAKHYTRISINRLMKRINNKVKRDINKEFKKTRI